MPVTLLPSLRVRYPSVVLTYLSNQSEILVIVFDRVVVLELPHTLRRAHKLASYLLVLYNPTAHHHICIMRLESCPFGSFTWMRDYRHDIILHDDDPVFLL